MAALLAVIAGCSKRGPTLAPTDSDSATAVVAAPRVPLSTDAVVKIYAGGLQPSWNDYGWTERNFAGPGPARLHFNDYGGWIIASPALRDSGALNKRFGGVAFRYKAPAAWGDFLEVRLSSDQGDLNPVPLTAAHLRPLEDGWVQAIVPMRELAPNREAFDRIRIRARRAVGKDEVLLDDISLTVPSANEVITYKIRDAKLVVHCGRPTLPISPHIYGVAGASPEPELRVGARRWGGNPTSRFNWQLGNAWNTASDWFFSNVAVAPFSAFLANDPKVFRAITVPTLGWVAKDTSSYSFSIKTLGVQQAGDPDHPDRGNGMTPAGAPLASPDPTTTSIAAPPSFVRAWVESIRKDDDAHGGVARAYILDNEPALWHDTHRDVHPEPVTYDELLDRTLRYGTAVRQGDPNASIAGPAEWGWPAFFYSAKDAKAGFKSKPDRLAHGDVPLLAWYLKSLREHEQKTGVRILDVVDVHFYPQGKGVFTNGGGGSVDSKTIALRLRSTRALWDPTYVDESWINEPVRLIPRLQELIAQNYPGRAISIGEWNFGGEHHISGALALAEALGRFAEGSVQSAYHWSSIKKGSPAYWAFRAFRNYDGKGSAFLGRYVISDHPEGTSLFVSRNDAGDRLVLIAMNFSDSEGAKLTIDTSSCGTVQAQKTFTYGGEPEGLVEKKTAPVADETLPPLSLAVLELTVAPKKP